MNWLLIEKPAPVLNVPHFEKIFSDQIPLNEKGHPLHNEFIALPDMCFRQVKQIGDSISEIAWPAYGSDPLYIDLRFCSLVKAPIAQPTGILSAQDLLKKMEQRIGVPYLWGGNWPEGIPEMLNYYPPKTSLSPRMQELWTFRGLDCSGLLFEAANGMTPRNTSQLIKWGISVKIENIKPMDMIVYPGHVVFVRDQQTIIESAASTGVRVYPLGKRLAELQEKREWVEEFLPQMNSSCYFTIRRFTT
ncbi:MAG: C40 family peptidase [Verrucomicrobiota bacterium]|nr:C40 family peptidase [Verrucomicrobiota bacterium]